MLQLMFSLKINERKYQKSFFCIRSKSVQPFLSKKIKMKLFFGLAKIDLQYLEIKIKDNIYIIYIHFNSNLFLK